MESQRGRVTYLRWLSLLSAGASQRLVAGRHNQDPELKWSLPPPGYANEVGEAFRSLVPAAVVWLSYGVSSSYVLADAIDKGKKAGEVSVCLP